PLHRMPAHGQVAVPSLRRRGDRRDRHPVLQEPVRGRGVAPRRDGVGEGDRRGRPPPPRRGRPGAEGAVSSPALGLTMLALIVIAFWGIASGIVGAVVVLMGVIAMRPMLRAGYDVKLASGVITAGGTLGILIPPSVMLIVYAAVAGQSIVKLYAAAMLPGFFLTFLYLVYILGWAIINPKIAPKLPADQYRVKVPEYLSRLERGPARR